MKDSSQNILVQEGWLQPFVESLRARGIRVLAPVQRDGVVNFREVTSANEIADGYVNTRVPLKEVLFPRTEKLLTYDRPDSGEVEFHPAEQQPQPTVVLGARPCDLSAVDVLDTVFNWDYKDTLYRQRRDNTTFVGVACTTSDSYCFCRSVGGGPDQNDGADLFIRPAADGSSVIEVLSERGQELAGAIDGKPAGGDLKLADPPATNGRFDVEKIKPWLDEHFEDDFWTDMSLACMGCGACSYLCPTCHCFDIVDEADWRSGERRRNWDCCSFALFTLHTSGHNPRPDQQSRCRNRIMHKFKYFSERFGRRACVGCGRCVRVCGAGQSIMHSLEDIATLASE